MSKEADEMFYVAIEIFDFETPQERFDILSKPMHFPELQQYIWDNYGQTEGRKIWFMKYSDSVKDRRLQN
jgi:hypothetical protein